MLEFIFLVISFIIMFIHSLSYSFIHSLSYSFIHYHINSFIHSFIQSLSFFSTVRSNRARDSCRNSYFWSFHSLSYSSTVRWIELGIGLIELGIDLRINNARRTVLARVSGLVFACVAGGHGVWMRVGCPCPPVRNNIVTPRHLFCFCPRRNTIPTQTIIRGGWVSLLVWLSLKMS